MNVNTVILVVFLPAACIAAAAALMRLFEVKEATSEQSQAEVARLLAPVSPEARVRHRVRAGAPSNATLAEFSYLRSQTATRIRLPSA